MRGYQIVFVVVSVCAPATAVHGGANLLWNGEFEDSRLENPSHPGQRWHEAIDGSWGRQEDFWSGPNYYGTYDGSDWFFSGTAIPNSIIYQDIDLSDPYYNVDQWRRDYGGLYADFGGYQRDFYWFPHGCDIGQISLEQFDAAGGVIDRVDLDPSEGYWWGWEERNGLARIDLGAQKLRYIFLGAAWADGTGNDAWLDGAYLKVEESAIWTYGNVSKEHWGPGDWTTGGCTIGNTRVGAVWITHGKTMTTTDQVIMGYEDDRSGHVHIDDGKWHSTGVVTAGYFGKGFIHVKSQGTWESDNTVTMGATASGKGYVDVNGGLWQADGFVRMGEGYHGEVDITDGGTWNSEAVTVGHGKPFYATISRVYVTDGTWDSDGTVIVGNKGMATVDVAADGKWISNGATRLAVSTWGEVDINAGEWTTNGAVTVGEGYKANVYVKNGGLWRSNAAVTLAGSADTLVQLQTNARWHAVGDVALNRGGVGLLSGTVWDTDGQVFNNAKVHIKGGRWQAAGAVSVGEASPATITLETGLMTLDAATLTVHGQGAVSIAGATLQLTNGAVGDFNSALTFSGNNGTLELLGGTLKHQLADLILNGSQIIGHGDVNLAQSTLNLGATAAPGSLTGTGPAARLNVYGDVCGSGEITNTNVYGDIDVGSSPGVMTLENVGIYDSTIVMEIAGINANQYDRIIIGNGVTFNAGELRVVFSDPFAPDDQDTFQLFSTIGGADLSSALAPLTIVTPADWQLDLTTGMMQIVPEPTGLLLLSLGGWYVRRRQRR